ncbi:Vault poly [Fusarium agapanthi]|uniref:Vault poly n=1 Tax=Fusarium agapanthi TaxID=1803897 RepID=A0A9P5BG91_9HYPO|nr:Vault poly [Fusarium agapanthi]
MASRHVFTQRLKSGVIFSAPGNLLAMPEGGWGDDTPINRQKKPKRKVQGRGLDHFSHWVAKVTPYEEPYDNVDSFAPGKDTRGIENEYRPYSIAPYSELEAEAEAAKIPEATLCLPMLSVSLTATVDGTVAHTELVQKFHNPSDITIHATKHVFPLYDGVVITSFECTIGDERRVRGVVKPKVQARKEFEEAVRDKVAAPALLEEHTPEIFETSLGKIPSNTPVEIKITYVQELKVVMMESEATEGIALTIPMSIAPRYSKAPIDWEPASKVPEEKLDIWIKVMDNGKVNQEGCEVESGHLLQFEGSKPAEYSNLLDKDASPKTYYVWHHESEPPVMGKDFVFVIQMNEGHQIKSGAVACPADDKGLAALRVNIRPNDLFRNAIIPQSFTGEILFLLDQSGSMDWSNSSPDYYSRRKGPRKIDVMREAMLLALSGIPSTCVFNVISWGSATMGLWESSRAHTRENIREAKGYVSQIEADMGGTDLLRALESVVKRRAKDRSTQIIILTDGELEPEDSIQFIWKKRQLFGDSIRFFALGIGDEVSHRLVESIAECGGGYSDVVHTTQTPRWHDRLNRLLKSALEPNSWSCDIDLGSGFERKTLIDYKLDQQTTAESDKTPYIQAPFPISSLHPFSFASISFLIDLRHGGELPKTVTISTTTTGAKMKTYELPIDRVSGHDGTIHRLVAKSVLLDLQDQIKRGETETQIAKANAENIGTMYSITSKWTSFVAISENQPTQTVEEQKMNHYKALFDEIDIDELLNNVSDDESSSCGSFSGSYSNIVYGSRQSPRMNSMAGPSIFSYPTSLGNHSTTGRVLESASETSIPAPILKACGWPARPPPGTLPTPQFLGHHQGGRPALRECSLDEDNDEPEASRPSGSPVAHDLEQEEQQGSGDRITSRSSRARSISPSVSRPWEVQEMSDSQDPAIVIDYDTRIFPAQRRFDEFEDGSSTFSGEDFSLFPNDSNQREAEILGFMQRKTTDNSRPNLAPLSAEFAEPPEVAAVAANPSSDEVYAQKASTPGISKSAYHVPVGSRRSRRRYAYDSEGNADDDTAQDHQPYHQRREDSAKEDVTDEPVAASSANRGIAIATEMAERTPAPAVASDSDDDLKFFDFPVHELRDPGQPETCSNGSGNSEAGTGRVSTDSRHMSTNPMARARRSSLDEAAYSDVVAAHNSRLHSATSKSRRLGQAPLFQASSQLSKHISAGCAPLGVRETVPDGLKFPTYKAVPIPNPRLGADVSFEPEFASRHKSIHRVVAEPLSSQQSMHYGPLDWQFAMECQDGQGLFDLDEKRSSLHLHFCPETAMKISPKISKLLHNSSTPEQERDDMCARLLDTLLMIECYKTHRAQEEDAWDLMMERAWDAVISVLGLGDEEEALEELAGQLRTAMMHAHYVAATGVKDSEKDESSVDTVRCPVCDVVWRTTRQFFCPFDHESNNEVDEFMNWDDFWVHQVGQGHVVCTQEVMY